MWRLSQNTQAELEALMSRNVFLEERLCGGDFSGERI